MLENRTEERKRRQANARQRTYSAKIKANPAKLAARRTARRAEWQRFKSDPEKMRRKRESDRLYRESLDQAAIDRRNLISKEYQARRRREEPDFRARSNGYSLAWHYRNRDRVPAEAPESTGVIRYRRETLAELRDILVELDATTGGAVWEADPYTG